MDVAPIWAALMSAGDDNPIAFMGTMKNVREAQRHVDLLSHEDTRAFRKRLLEVQIVKTESGDGRPLPGKAKLVLEPDEGDDEPETIETNWLNDPWADAINLIAMRHIGQVITVWKHNTEPDDGAPQGYRRCVWVEGGGAARLDGAGGSPSPSVSPSTPPERTTSADHGPPDASTQSPDLTVKQQLVLTATGRCDPATVERLRAWREAEYPDLMWPWPNEVCDVVVAKIEELMNEPF